MVVRSEDRVVTNRSLEKLILIDAPYEMTGLQDERLPSKEIWDLPNYTLEAYGERSLADLIGRAKLSYHAPVPYGTDAEVIARMLSGENESWKVYRVLFEKGGERVLFDLVLKANSAYMKSWVGLDFSGVLDMTLRVFEHNSGCSMPREACYKRALSDTAENRRFAFAGWDPNVGFKTLALWPREGINKISSDNDARVATYMPPEIYNGEFVDIEAM